MILLMFVCALALSGAAGFYSIVGLMAIFAAAPIPIAIMGTTLEVSKLVVASWLYRNWKQAPFLLKSYLTSALVLLMFLTSMGIFGFLSAAHMEQTTPAGDAVAQVALIDEKLNTEKENLNAARKQLSQLDSQVDQLISRTTDDTGISRSASVRRAQARERAAIASSIERSQAQIAELNQQKAPLAAQVRQIEAEVGPIKYIAALIYGDSTQEDLLEKAVRWVIIMIVAVFDPLAVLMLIAANWSLTQSRLNNNGPPADVNHSIVSISDSVRLTDEPSTTHQTPPPVGAVEHPTFTPDEQVWISRPPSRS